MAEIDIAHIVNAIPDKRRTTAVVFEPSGKRKRLNCLFKEGQSPGFYLLCPPGSVGETIDKSQQCLMTSNDANGNPVALAAEIIDISNNRVIDLLAIEVIEPQDLREFFRVNMRVKLTISFQPDKNDTESHAWDMEGQTIDISQSGLLAFFPEECPNKKNIIIQMILPNPEKTIFCMGHVIRSSKVRKDRWRTAFHFDEITGKNQDLVAKNCFAEQRKQLRERVNTEG